MKRERASDSATEAKNRGGRGEQAKKDVLAHGTAPGWVLWLKRKGKSNLSGDLLYDASRETNFPAALALRFGNSVVSIDPYTEPAGDPILGGIANPTSWLSRMTARRFGSAVNGRASVWGQRDCNCRPALLPRSLDVQLTVNGSNFVRHLNRQLDGDESSDNFRQQQPAHMPWCRRHSSVPRFRRCHTVSKRHTWRGVSGSLPLPVFQAVRCIQTTSSRSVTRKIYASLPAPPPRLLAIALSPLIALEPALLAHLSSSAANPRDIYFR